MGTVTAILLCLVALVLGAAVSGLLCYKLGYKNRQKTAEMQMEWDNRKQREREEEGVDGKGGERGAIG